MIAQLASLHDNRGDDSENNDDDVYHDYLCYPRNHGCHD
jgi:hypothetical protein